MKYLETGGHVLPKGRIDISIQIHDTATNTLADRSYCVKIFTDQLAIRMHNEEKTPPRIWIWIEPLFRTSYSFS